jgi:16S rRNA processing protein RimM
VLAVGLRVSVAGVNHSVIRVGGTAERPVIRLRAITSRAAAVELRGEPMLVERATLPLEPDEYWADDLVGLAVVDGVREVGVVARVRALPSCDVLEVGVTSPGDPTLRGPGDETLLIPLISDAVRDVDLAAGRIDVDLRFLDAG